MGYLPSNNATKVGYLIDTMGIYDIIIEPDGIWKVHMYQKVPHLTVLNGVNEAQELPKKLDI